MTWLELATPAAAAVGAGFVNALAGGGTLLSFPALTAIGIPTVAANVTSAVALCPGYLGATYAQRRDLAGQRRRLWRLVPAAALGGATGAMLLLSGSERIFRSLVPYLIVAAAALLALQDPLRRWLMRRASIGAPIVAARSGEAQIHTGKADSAFAAVAIGVVSVYGGYFAAGISVIVLALLGLLVDDTLTRLNALKQAIALAINVAAAVVFLASGQVIWPAALVMAAGALIGGVIGGRMASAVNPQWLRATVVSLGVVIALIYWIR